ncbi:MAG: AraC family transcriptional regulator, partial [Clostridiales bacterium]
SPIQSVDTIRKAIAFMNQNFTEQITIKEVADHIHMNPTYFSSIFKKATKKPFSQYLQQIRVEESKLLLTTTQQSILSVAISCGFSSQSYFTKVFIKNTGITPKEYRLQNAVIPIFQDNK